jgi:hypothetical protein
MCGGILIGAVVAFGLVKLAHCAFRRHYAYGGRCGYGGYGHGGHCGRGGWGRGDDDGPGPYAGGPGGGFGKRYFLRWLFERLDTSPGQEKVILEAVDEIKGAVGKAKGEWKTSFADVAKAIRGEEFDHSAVSDAWVRHDGLFEEARVAISNALQRVHDALDEKQRTILADLIENGPARFGGFGRGRWSGRSARFGRGGGEGPSEWV